MQPMRGFNPHPPLRADAMTKPPHEGGGIEGFQSSPALTGGCYASARNTQSPIPPCFNPHPPLRADAMFCWSCVTNKAKTFQSSPALTGGCYRFSARLWYERPSFNPHPPLRADAIADLIDGFLGDTVSILTRPYGRMLFISRHEALSLLRVSILTRPYGRMLFSLA